MQDLINNLTIGFGVAFTLQNLAYAFIGCLLGTLIGVLPGIGPIATIAMLLPATYALPPVAALIMLAGIYYGAQYGGSTTAILVNLPGESSSVVTVIDGYQMARKGRAGPALAAAGMGSFFAGCVGTLILAAFAAPLTEVAFKFGPAEYFSLMVLGLIGAVVLASGSLPKAIAMIVLGLLLGLIGTPIAHSAAPAMHEAAARAAGFELHYHLIEVAGAGRADLVAILDGVRRMGFSGINVTYPYKEAVVPLLDALSPEARAMGAVNTVVARDGVLTGHNTDATGFATAYRALGRSDGDAPVAIIGTGGVGKAIGFALAGCGVSHLRLYDSDRAKAQALADQIGTRAQVEICGGVGRGRARQRHAGRHAAQPRQPHPRRPHPKVAVGGGRRLSSPLDTAAQSRAEGGRHGDDGPRAQHQPGRRCFRAVHRGPGPGGCDRRRLRPIPRRAGGQAPRSLRSRHVKHGPRATQEDQEDQNQSWRRQE